MFNQVVYHDIDEWARAVLAMSPDDHERVIGNYRDFADIALQNADIAREEADIAHEKADIARMAEEPTALLIKDAESRAREANDLNHTALTYELQASALERVTKNKPRMGPTATKYTKLRDRVFAERREKLAEKRLANAMAKKRLLEHAALLLMVQGPTSLEYDPFSGKPPPKAGSRRRNKKSKNSKKRSNKSHRRK
jgi:hypothetical protein